jgi:hypothetical protein
MISNKHNFLHVENEEGEWKSLQRIVRQKEATVKQVKTGTDAVELLTKYPDLFQGVILDFNCVIKQGEEPTNRFLSFVQDGMAKLNLSIPVVVLSGNPAAEERATQENMKFFKKYDPSGKRGPDECIDYLLMKAKDLPITKLKNDFAEVFEVFSSEHDYLGADSEKKFIEFLRKRDTTDTDEIRQNFWASRELLTDIYAAMARKKPAVIPEIYRKSGYELAKIISHFMDTQESGSRKNEFFNKRTNVTEEGRDRSVTDIEAYMINRTGNICGLHKQGDLAKSDLKGKHFDADFVPTPYTHKMVIFGMCDYLLWFKGWMNKN